MSDMSDIELMLGEWFDHDAPTSVPPGLTDAVLAQTSHTRRRQTWRLYGDWAWFRLASRLGRPARTTVVLVTVALLAIAVVGVAMVVGSRRPVPAPFGLAANGRIAFTIDGRLVTADANGRAVRAVDAGSVGQGAPTFSRDGTKILYRDFLGPTVESAAFGTVPLEDLVVADADGTHARVVVHDVAAGSPEWSPDGRWISYAGADLHAYVAPADGSAAPTDLGDFGSGAWTPSWAPDSTRLAVSVLDGSVWIASRDGTSARKVTHGTYVEASDGAWSADWSPDGTQLLCAAGDPSAEMDLYRIGLDGGPERLVERNSNDAVWSPDGSMFAFLTDSARGGAVLTIADPTGREIRTLGSGYGWFMPAWSPDGARIAVLDDTPAPDDTAGPPVIDIVDVHGVAPAIIIPAGSRVLGDERPDITLTWQRVAP